MGHRKTLAHLSDLHLGHGRRSREHAEALVDAALKADFDHVLVTGDVTHRGRWSEYEAFLDVFRPLIVRGKLLLVPGNHDRNGDDIAEDITGGHRVQTYSDEELYCVLFDSTAPHNRFSVSAHGQVTATDFEQLDDAFERAPKGALVVGAMHHHPYPLPEESTIERLSAWLGLPFTHELDQGAAMLSFLSGRCDVILHGHRHVPTATALRGPRPLRIYNAGSSTELGCFRVFEYCDGQLQGAPRWHEAHPRRPRRAATGVELIQMPSPLEVATHL